MGNNRKNNKQPLKLAVLALLFVASIAIIGLGDSQNIYYIKTLGYMTASKHLLHQNIRLYDGRIFGSYICKIFY